MTLPYEAIVSQLVALGVPRDRAERQASLETGRAPAAAAATPAPRRAITWPVRLTIPWSMLCSDNRKYTTHGDRLVLREEYRIAKMAVRRTARDVVGDAEPAQIPLRLVAAVYVPDRRPHDVANFAKCVHDALEDSVYASDRWLDDVHWLRAGVDVDRPRAEITISPVNPP